VSLDLVERIANAVLYEGYILYPYRPSSVKNRRRFNFGVLVPPAYAAAQTGAESSVMRTECLVCGNSGTMLDVRVRFLRVIAESEQQSWQSAIEREVCLAERSLGDLAAHGFEERFCFRASEGPNVQGAITVTVQSVEESLFRLAAEVANSTAWDGAPDIRRDEILPYSMAAAHTVLAVREGQFVSLLDPADRWREAAGACRNVGTWPVLAGEPGECGYMLSSPIILYDYPQIAPESPGDLFDVTEIDEILTLRIMTLTDEEKAEVRSSDERARRILERTESLPPEHFMKLHGALRGLRPAGDAR